jgi:peptide/nickel transport system substrate-binding protein
MHIFDEQFIAAEGRERMQQWPPMGTGPFMGEEGSWEKGVSIEVFKNPNYFVEGRPFLDGQKFFFIPDKGTRIAAFLTGQLNFGVRPNVAEAQELMSKMGDGVFIQKAISTTWWDLILDTLNPPFNDIRVREAVAWALDKDGMIEAVRQGLGAKGGTIAVQSGWELPTEELNTFAGYSGTREENIVKAKALLADAGFPNGLVADVWTRQHPSYVDPSTVARALLDEVGITGEIVFAEQAVYFANQKDHDVWDIMSAGHRYTGTDPNFMIPEYWLEGGSRNSAGYSSPEIASLNEQQKRELDPVKRKDLVNQIERLQLGSYAIAVAYYNIAQYAWASNVKNYFTHSAYNANQQFRDVWME